MQFNQSEGMILKFEFIFSYQYKEELSQADKALQNSVSYLILT